MIEVNEQADLWAGMVQTACPCTWEFTLGQAQDACWLHDLDSKYRPWLGIIIALMALPAYLTFDTECHLPHCTEVANNTAGAEGSETIGSGSRGTEPEGRNSRPCLWKAL